MVLCQGQGFPARENRQGGRDPAEWEGATGTIKLKKDKAPVLPFLSKQQPFISQKMPQTQTPAELGTDVLSSLVML